MRAKIGTGPILCLSQLHTGTWSTLSWLAAHDEVNGLMLSTGVYDVLAGGEGGRHEMASGLHVERFHRRMVYHEHVRTDHRFGASMSRTQLVMASVFRTVIPLRDPLAALVSYQHRAEVEDRIGTDEFKPVDHVAMRWVIMATERSLPNLGIVFVPWDLIVGTDAKIRRLLGLASTTLGLFGGAVEAADQAMRVRDNSSGDYPLRQAYEAGDMATLERNVAGLDFLRNREPQLRPFLELCGYQNLMWWS